MPRSKMIGLRPSSSPRSAANIPAGPQPMMIMVLADAEAALIGLGFKPQDAARALAQIGDPDADVESLIKLALKLLA